MVPLPCLWAATSAHPVRALLLRPLHLHRCVACVWHLDTQEAPWCGSWSTCPVCGQEVAWRALPATYGRYGSKAALTQIPTGLGSPNVHQDVLAEGRVAHFLIVE